MQRSVLGKRDEDERAVARQGRENEQKQKQEQEHTSVDSCGFRALAQACMCKHSVVSDTAGPGGVSRCAQAV